MKRRHVMPFGAAFDHARGVLFRLWAPAAGTVELLLEAPQRQAPLPMSAVGEGWFELAMDAAAPGTRYRYRIDGGPLVPDPAARFNPEDVHAASEVIDPEHYDWQDGAWRGRSWDEAVIYELHVGAFTREGTFEAAARRLPHLKDLGVTAVELMPVADFPGARNWGYDGVLLFAPDSRYGRPEDLKRLIDEAHRLQLMVLLDVVYNHFGPDGNYLHLYARDFFSEAHHTPWGAAINFDGAGSRVVRDFYMHNALYWLEEFHFDGLRLDAVHAIMDDSRPHVLEEIAQAVRAGPVRTRHVHLILENDHNAARFLARDTKGTARLYDAQWNDDAHHALHTLLTGEGDGYYADYADEPARHLARTLSEGFAYQGDFSRYRKHPRGEFSRNLPPGAFVAFLQNHDQIGNRAFGERITTLAPASAVQAALALLLLAPWRPMLFMGEEFGCTHPFPFFCDFGGELARAVTEGRRREFAAFARFQEPGAVDAIPDPNAEATFAMSVLDWEELREPGHAAWLAQVRELLQTRHREIVPVISGIRPGGALGEVFGRAALRVEWLCGDGSRLAVAANLASEICDIGARSVGRVICACPAHAAQALASGQLPAWSVVWTIAASA